MIFKLLILLLNTGILVHSSAVIAKVEPYNVFANLVYGWDVIISNSTFISTCYGTFIAPRVYITDPLCLNKYPNITSSEIQKDQHGSLLGKRISFSLSNVYYSEDLDTTFNRNKRKIAVVITDEQVEPEQAKGEYVRVNSNLDDIASDKCYVPHYDGSTIEFTFCDTVYFDNRYGNPANVYCVGSELVWKLGSGLFCRLKEKPDVDVLVGIVVGDNNAYRFWGDESLFMATVENISGLNDTIIENINNELLFKTVAK